MSAIGILCNVHLKVKEVTFKSEQLENMMEMVQRVHPDTPTFLCGDLNRDEAKA